MKKQLSLLILILAISFSANAQSGKVWIGGSVGFSSSKVNDPEYDAVLNYNIVPEVGYMISDNWGLGIKLGYELRTESDSEFEELEEFEGLKINPFVRYVFLNKQIANIFIDGGVGYTNTKNTENDLKSHTFEVGFRPGVMLNVSDKVALTGKFGFLGYRHDNFSQFFKVNTFGFDLDLSQIQLGMNFKF